LFLGWVSAVAMDIHTRYTNCWRRFAQHVWDPVHSSTMERIVVQTAWQGGVQTKLVEEGSEKYPPGNQTLVTLSLANMPAEFNQPGRPRSVWQLSDATLPHVHAMLASQALALTQKGVCRPPNARSTHGSKECWELAVLVPLNAVDALSYAAWRNDACDLLEGDDTTYVGLVLLKAASVWSRTAAAPLHQGNIAYAYGAVVAAVVALVELVWRDGAVMRECTAAVFVLLVFAFHERRVGTPWKRLGLTKGSDWTSAFLNDAHRSSARTAAVQHHVFANSNVYSEPRPVQVPAQMGCVGTNDYGWRYVAEDLRAEMSALVARDASIGALEHIANTRWDGTPDHFWKWIGGRGDSVFGDRLPSSGHRNHSRMYTILVLATIAALYA
jgi:hypothetical protein